MRILHVINCIEIGGAETFLLRLLKELENQGHTNFLMTLEPDQNNADLMNNFLKETKTTVLPVYKTKETFFTQFMYRLNGIAKRLSGKEFYDGYRAKLPFKYYTDLKTKHRIDLINSHLLSSDFYALNYLKPAMNIPLVITSQGCYNDFKDVTSVARLMDGIDGMTYVAEKNLTIFKETGKPLPFNRKLVYNGMEQPIASTIIKRESIGLEETDFVVGQISRSIPSKGMEVAIKAVIHLNEEKRLNTIKLVLIGPENEYYLRLKETYKSYPYLLFPGVALNPTDWVEMFDIGILPSYFPSESCPSSIVEYLSLGKPALATPIGEIPHMILSNDGSGGKTITATDHLGLPDPLAFAEQIQHYYEHPKILQQDSEHALKAFTKFDIQHTAAKYLGVYQEALNSHG